VGTDEGKRRGSECKLRGDVGKGQGVAGHRTVKSSRGIFKLRGGVSETKGGRPSGAVRSSGADSKRNSGGVEGNDGAGNCEHPHNSDSSSSPFSSPNTSSNSSDFLSSSPEREEAEKEKEKDLDAVCEELLRENEISRL
jgi:hypothetical protein